MDKKQFSERDICSKFITPALVQAGWNLQTQIREEVTFTAGRIIVRGGLHSRGKQRRADYVLSYQQNQPIAVIEAKDNSHSLGDGMQQALAYSDALDVPFVFSSNGDGYQAVAINRTVEAVARGQDQIDIGGEAIHAVLCP